MRHRLKSKCAWAAVSALVLFVLKNWGMLEPIGFTQDSFTEFSDLIFAVLIGFGIFNNPTTLDKF